ncbi:MAG: DUF2577 domain-containing protein [Muribaculaceae bacterium]|nr:DUF2577 domain-containing protein [Muribaculaceae bacterium]
MSQAGEFWKNVREQAKTVNQAPVMIGQVATLEPFVINFQGVEIGASYGDNIYINNLLLDENINLDVASMDSAQTINPALWQADNSPTSNVEISGTQKQFLTDFYNWFKAFHNRFILHIDDYVAVQRLGNNTYLILQKVGKNEQ